MRRDRVEGTARGKRVDRMRTVVIESYEQGPFVFRNPVAFALRVEFLRIASTSTSPLLRVPLGKITKLH